MTNATIATGKATFNEPHRERRLMSRLAKFGLFPSESEIARRFSQDPSTWASKAIVLERHGFPQIDPLMGGRYWPACTAWWNKRYGLVTVEVSQPDGGENLDALA